MAAIGGAVRAKFPSDGLSVQPAGTPFHANDTASSNPGTKVEILSFTVPASTDRRIEQVIGTSCQPGIFTLENNATGEILASLATSPSEHTKVFNFTPYRPMAAGTVLKMYFNGTTDNPVTTVYGFTMATDIPT